jgi:hypothetical protein
VGIFHIQNTGAKITPPPHSTMCCLNILYSLKRRWIASVPGIQIDMDTHAYDHTYTGAYVCELIMYIKFRQQKDLRFSQWWL